MSTQEIERAIKLFEEAIKKKKDNPSSDNRQKIVFLRGRPLFFPIHNAARQFEIEFLWLRPKELKASVGIVEKRRPPMYA